MPNHITTIIRNPSEAVLAALVNDDHEVDFNKLIPMPAVLQGTSEGWGPEGKYVNEDAIKETGYNSWYDWSCDKWGTKWNAYSTSIDSATLRFDTAWALPEPVLAELSRITGEVIEGEWADEDIGHNCGYFQAEDGVVNTAPFEIPVLGAMRVKFGVEDAQDAIDMLRNEWELDDEEIADSFPDLVAACGPGKEPLQ